MKKYMMGNMNAEEMQAYSKKHRIGHSNKVKNLILHVKSNRKLINERKKILIYSPRMESVLDLLGKEYDLVFYNDMESHENHVVWVRYTWDAMNAELKQNESVIYRIKRNIIEDIRKYNIVALIVAQSVNTLDYIIMDSFKELKLPIIICDHGLLASAVVDPKFTRNWMFNKQWYDFFWFWSERNRQLYIDNNICDAEHSFVCGYPKKYEHRANVQKKSVCFVGECSEGDMEAAHLLHDNVKVVIDICQQEGIPFFYKKHPKEDLSDLFVWDSNFGDRLIDDLQVALDENYIIIGGRTTAMLEGALNGNFVIQIDYCERRCKDFLFSSVYRIADVRRELPEMLEKVMRDEIFPMPIDSYEIGLFENTSVVVRDLFDLLILKNTSTKEQ